MFLLSKNMSNVNQLSVKEVSSGVYRWINGSSRLHNPALRVYKLQYVIKIQNPTDTKS